MLPRCCERHDDLGHLLSHLTAGYPTLPQDTVALQVHRAVEAVSIVRLREEPLRIVELIARSHLAVLSGERTDGARLDPERHPSRQPQAARD